ncbi:hypothetical protein YC2023_041079 [Brassica napus]
MFLLLNPRGEDDFTKTHLQQVLKLYSKELPDKNYASNTRKQSTFLERCVSKRKYCALAVSSDDRYLATRGVDRHVHIWDVHTREHVTGTLFLPYDSDTEPRSSTLVHLIEVSRSALTVGRDTIMQLHKEKAPYVAKANESQG